MGAEPPAYAHLPLITGPNGQPLSKRFGSVARMRTASVDELAATPGVGPRTARVLHEHLHSPVPASARRAG